MSEAQKLYFSKGTFIPCLIHRGKWRMQSHTEVAQTFQKFCPYWNQDFFLYTFPTNDVVYSIFWPWRPMNILWPSFDKGCSTRKLIFPQSVFLYIFNLCQPQKMPNRVTFHRVKVQWVTRKNQLAQKSDVVNFKATLVFLTFSLC